MKSLNFLFPEPQKLVLIEEDVSAVGPNTVLIESIVSHVSTGTEMWCYRGIFDPNTVFSEWVKFPFRPGYSTAGRVLEVGRDVVGVKPGDLVHTGRPHQQYVTVEYGEKERNNLIGRILTKIPDGLVPDEMIWASMAGVAIVGCRKAKIEFGEYVAVIGAGPIGQLTSQYAKLCGAVRVVSIDTVQKRLDCALEGGGATDVLCMDAQSAISAVEEVLGTKPEVVFDTTGNYAVLQHACLMVKTFGRIILNGDTPEPSKQIMGPVVSRSLDIRAVHGNIASDLNSLPWVGKRNAQMNMELLLQKRIKVKHLISHRYKPQEAPEVYKKLAHDRSYSMGVVFDWSDI